MNPFLRGLRMAGDDDRFWTKVFLAGVDLVCLFEAGDSAREHKWVAALAWLVLAVVFSLVGFNWPRIRRRIWRHGKPDLDIVWKPGEFPYLYEYPLPPGHRNVQYRVCVVNNANHALSNVRVTLTKLVPLVLNCVPCPLKLMHDNTAPYPTSFNLPPRGEKFVDLLLQRPGWGDSNFWLFHTVTEVRDWVVPSQGYCMTIRAESDDTDPVSRDFELVRNGQLWDLKDRGITKTPRMSDGQPETHHISLQPQLKVTRVIAQSWKSDELKAAESIYGKSSTPPVKIVTRHEAMAYYFEISGTSESVTVRDVRVQLERIIPPVKNLDWLPVLLFHKHDQPPHKEKFDLHPGDVKHIDLVSAYRGDDHFEVRHIVGGVNRDVPTAGHHCLTVAITASDTPKISASFDVFMDSDGVLQCNIV